MIANTQLHFLQVASLFALSSVLHGSEILVACQKRLSQLEYYMKKTFKIGGLPCIL
jgi:hypothetical protein